MTILLGSGGLVAFLRFLKEMRDQNREERTAWLEELRMVRHEERKEYEAFFTTYDKSIAVLIGQRDAETDPAKNAAIAKRLEEIANEYREQLEGYRERGGLRQAAGQGTVDAQQPPPPIDRRTDLTKRLEKSRLLNPALLTPDDYVARGNAAFELQLYDEALVNYTRALELRADDPVALNNRDTALDALDALKRHDQAPADLDLAQQHSPRLVLYPEISSPTREVEENWRKRGVAPLKQDYHPRSVELILHNSEQRPDGGLTIFPDIHNTDRDGFWRRYAELDKQAYPHTTYAWIVHKDDLTAIEYWLAYPYNDWRSTHEGDWEVVMVFLRDGAPIACAYSAHHGGYRLPWELVETDGTHPIVYVANGSHANYFFGPRKYNNTAEAFGLTITTGEFPFTGGFVDFTTSTSEDGVLVTPTVTSIPSDKSAWWDWLNIEGRWGKTEVPRWLKWLPKKIRFELSSRVWGAPRALPPRDNWKDPFTWADEKCEAPQFLGSWLARFR